jgi:hypothetical protein
MSSENNHDTFCEFIHSYPITSLKHIKYVVYISLFILVWRLLMRIDEKFATF